MSIKLDADTLSGFLKRSTDILFFQNPLGTAMGVVLGFILDAFGPIFARSYQIDLTGVKRIAWVAVGVFFCNLPILFRPQRLDPTIEAAFAAIRKARKNGEISKSQTRIMY